MQTVRQETWVQFLLEATLIPSTCAWGTYIPLQLPDKRGAQLHCHVGDPISIPAPGEFLCWPLLTTPTKVCLFPHEIEILHSTTQSHTKLS